MERILCGELLGKYLPHFQYQLVRLRDYSNKELLEKGDEISLAMLINKIQCPEDVSAFVNIPGEQVDEILKDTPEYLLDVMAKLLRALSYSMNLPEDETETVVSKIKERKMARLFENVKMDIQAERRETEEAKRKLEEAMREAEEAKNKEQEMARLFENVKMDIQTERREAREARRDLEEAQRNLEEAQRNLEEVQREAKEAQREKEEERNAADSTLKIYKHILKMLKKKSAESEIKESLMQNFSLTKEQAEEEYQKAFEEE